MDAANLEEMMMSSSNSEGQETRRSPDASPLVFVSHDSRDADLAEAFSKLLSSVSAGVLKSFRSSDKRGTQGIDYGVEWYPELMAKLKTASDVVCLLTRRSLDRPWLLYEAGVAKGKLDTPVHGVALGISLSKLNQGPFAQFQNVEDTEDDLTKLVVQLVNRIPGADPDRDAVRMQVRAFRDRVKDTLDLLQAESEGDGEEPSVAKLFEEIKVMFRDLPGRLEERVSPVRRMRMRHFHPHMIDEIIQMTSRGPRDPVGFLVILSFIREDFPWLYELGMDAYRKLNSRDRRGSEEALHAFRRTVDMTLHGPFGEMGIRSKEAHLMMHELPMLLDHWMMRFAHEEPSEDEKQPAQIAATNEKEPLGAE